MQRHTSFWLGVFIALIIAIPLTMGFVSSAEEYAIRYSDFLAGIGFCIVLFLVLLLFFREPILKRITGSTKSEFVDFVEKVKLLFLEKTTEQEKAQAVTEITTIFSNWYIWTRFYKWVIATCIAILIAAAGFAGSVLLAKQNTIMNLQKDQVDLQNDLQIFEAQAFIRSQLDTSPVPITKVTEFNSTDTLISFNYPSCEITGELNFSGEEFDAVANSSTMFLINNLLKQERLKAIVQEALNNLFNDNDSGVAMSSLLILDYGNEINEGQDILNGSNLAGNYELENYSGKLHFDNSFVGMKCANCDSAYFETSFIGETNITLKGEKNIYLWDITFDHEVNINQINDLHSSLVLLKHVNYLQLVLSASEKQPNPVERNWYGVFDDFNERQNIQIHELGDDVRGYTCQSFEELCQENPFMECHQ